MNRREFLLSLLSVPFGWKALFRKEVKKEKWIEQAEEIDDCVECKGAGWTVSPNDLVGLGGDLAKMINTGRESMSEEEWNDRMDCRSAYLGGGEIGKANNGSLLGAARDVLDQCECEVEWKIGYGQCESEPELEPGQWAYFNEVCQFLSEVIARDVPGMLLEGVYDIDWIPPNVYIRQDCGSLFWCEDIDAEKTWWYRKVEKPLPNSDLLCTYEWELIT